MHECEAEGGEKGVETTGASYAVLECQIAKLSWDYHEL